MRLENLSGSNNLQTTDPAVTRVQGPDDRYIGLMARLKDRKLRRSLPEKPQTGDQLKEAELIADLSTREEEIYKAASSLFLAKKERGSHIEIFHIEPKGPLVIPSSLPEPIISLIERAYAHEVAINPEIESFNIRMDLRLQTPENWKGSSAQDPHFDFSESQSVSLYMLSSNPSTVQYTGVLAKKVPNINWNPSTFPTHEQWLEKTSTVKNPAASSLVPWKMYHADGKFLHSEPWGLFKGADVSKNPEKRFFFRLAFYF